LTKTSTFPEQVAGGNLRYENTEKIRRMVLCNSVAKDTIVRSVDMGQDKRLVQKFLALVKATPKKWLDQNKKRRKLALESQSRKKSMAYDSNSRRIGTFDFRSHFGNSYHTGNYTG